MSKPTRFPLNYLAWRMFAVIAIVIVIVPITIGAPTVFILIPPTMIRGVATFASFVQLVASVFGLLAVAAMMLDGFMKAMIRFANAPLAIIVCTQSGRAREEQETGHRGAC